MTLDQATFWAFFLVFIRCSAMMLAAPFFGAQSVPVRIRVAAAAALAICLTPVLKPHVSALPNHVLELALQAGHEVLAGLLIGALFNLILQAIQMAGAMADLQIGLGSSQILNPVNGVPITVIGQFKFLLALVLFVSTDAHHTVLRALVASYEAAPASLGSIQTSLLELLQSFGVLALQIAAPIVAVGFVVDAALGLVNKSVPSMQVFYVGLPAKILMGLTLIALTLPAVVTALQQGVTETSDALIRMWQGGR